jgi:hypothetical protein
VHVSARIQISALLILKLLAQAVRQQMKERWIVLSDANQISLIFRPLAQAFPQTSQI